MATLHDFVEKFISALDISIKQATDAHTAADRSAKAFYDAGERLKGNIQGQGADAFFNVFAVNNQRCQLLLAKLNDYYNASSSLKRGVEEVTTKYDNYDTYHPFGMGAQLDPVRDPSLTAYGVWQRLRTAFATNAFLDLALSQAESEIGGALNAERDRIFAEIDHNYSDISEVQQTVDKMGREAGKDSPIYKNAQSKLTELQGEHNAARSRVQTIVTNMHDHLMDWSFEINTLIRAYIDEVDAAAEVDKITVSDLIYEANLPQYANTPVIIEQLPDGGLLVLVKGGNAEQVENTIRNYLAAYGYSNPAITIMGYGNGETVAQKVITDAQNPKNDLPFRITNAIMVGNGNYLPDPTGMPVNYLVYNTMPDEDQRPFYQLTSEQYALMGVTLLLAIPTEGGDMLLSGEEITGAAILRAAGKEGVTKIEEYAAALGYNSSHPELEDEANFLAKKLQNYPNYADHISLSNDGGKTVMSASEYLQKYHSLDLKDPHVQVYYKGAVILPEEAGLNTSNLNNDAYLGSQFIPSPTGVSAQHGGVSQPVQGAPALGN